jgi:hypothetical protein
LNQISKLSLNSSFNSSLFILHLSTTSALEDGTEKERAELSKRSQESLDTLELVFTQKIAEIDVLVLEKDINVRVCDCRVILAKIEAEYCTFFQKAVAVFDRCRTRFGRSTKSVSRHSSKFGDLMTKHQVHPQAVQVNKALADLHQLSKKADVVEMIVMIFRPNFSKCQPAPVTKKLKDSQSSRWKQLQQNRSQ